MTIHTKNRLNDLNNKINKKTFIIHVNENNNFSVQDFVKKLRKPIKINERGEFNLNTVNDQQNEKVRLNRKTIYDQPREEEKFRNNIDDLNVTVDFIPLEVYDDYIFWGGTIDGIIQFVYKVSPEENKGGVKFSYSDEFTSDNPDNDEIIKRIENYYDQFYKYWRDNIFKSNEN